MKTQAIVPAVLQRDAHGVPCSPLYGDLYHPAAGALEQAQHVFLAGNGLPERWRGRDRFVVLETGFGLGNNFLATWDAWRRDEAACAKLHFISIEQHPLMREDFLAVPRAAALAALAQKLAAAWPALTCNLHRLSFDDERVELLLALGDVAAWLPELAASVDAFYLDGFAPSKNPGMWQPRLFKSMGRMAAPGATAATWTAARAVRESLAAAGFETRPAPGCGGKRDITLARFAPVFTPRRAVARPHQPASNARHAAIVGAGLAGCATAWALARQGWSSTLFDRHAEPADEASGNPAGIFHGIVNAQDGIHARFNRAAAFHAEAAVSTALLSGEVGGEVSGLLRLETSGASASEMQVLLQRLGLPSDYARAIDAAQASELSGLALAHPAWWFPGGGWVNPREFARHFLHRAGSQTQWRGSSPVHSLQREGARWRLLDADGALLDSADAVVLANAGDALRLLGHPAWPLQKVRGQISMLEASQLPVLARLPLAGAGYLIPQLHGWTVFGATSQPGDEDIECRDIDHAYNVSQLANLVGQPVAVLAGSMRGRVGWRWTTPDRLPLIGAVPDESAATRASRLDQPRLVPRVPGLYVFTGLGSRGIGWCALGGQVVAAAVSGAPMPLEGSLLDAVDPARFISRAARKPQR